MYFKGWLFIAGNSLFLLVMMINLWMYSLLTMSCLFILWLGWLIIYGYYLLKSKARVIKVDYNQVICRQYYGIKTLLYRFGLIKSDKYEYYDDYIKQIDQIEKKNGYYLIEGLIIRCYYFRYNDDYETLIKQVCLNRIKVNQGYACFDEYVTSIMS